MSAQHLNALSSPSFPQTFESVIEFHIRRVSRIAELAQLGQCDFEDEHCDCREKATIHHLASEREFCERHFRRVWYVALAAEAAKALPQ
jgi:hypothetical protein